MNIAQICKYAGIITLVITALMMLGGVIGFFTGEFLNVKRFSNYFWFANSFALFGIFCIVSYIALRKDNTQ